MEKPSVRAESGDGRAAPADPRAEEALEVLHQRLAEILRGGEDRTIAAVECLLAAGARCHCSDLHLEPQNDRLRLRVRLLGALRDMGWVSREDGERLVARLKVLAKLPTYQRRLPQDGRIRFRHGDLDLDLRIAILPAVHGETAVLRFPGSDLPLPGLDALGLGEEQRRAFEEALARPSGTILLTGPAGSGKSTTLYAALRHIQRVRQDSRHILTIEDPVERDVAGITQCQVSPAGGVTFALGLRAALRQDPDVIMVGEIRDRETAEIAVQAGLTGHLVLSTLHSGSAAGVFTRLIHLDIEPYMVAASLSCVAAQRLVRTLCPGCAAEASAPERLAAIPGWERYRDRRFLRGRGCAACGGSGYAGREGVFEFLAVDDDIRDLILRRAPEREIRAAALRRGHRTLLDNALEKALAGRTSLDEAARLAQ